MPKQVQWNAKRKDQFREWIREELTQTLGDRQALEHKWIEEIAQYRARVFGDGVADSPFVGSSDLEFPLTSIHAEPIYWDLMQTLHVPRNFWSVEPLRNDSVETANPFEEFLTVVERNFLKMRGVNQKAFLDLVVLGTCVYKDRIQHRSVSRRMYNEAGETEKRRIVTFQPVVQHIPLQDFIIPAYADHIDPDMVGGAPWVSHRIELTESQLRERVRSEEPFQPNYDKKEVDSVLSWVTDQRDDRVKEDRRRQDENVPFQDRKIILHEVHARFDVDGDGFDDDVVVLFHRESARILRATHETHDHGKRAFESAQYMPGYGFYGTGVGEADDWAQIAMTRMLNNAIDNVSLANMRMFSAPFGSNIQPDEPLYSGKIWFHGANETPVKPLQMGEVYPSLFNLMGMVQQWSELRTGASDVRSGDLSTLPSRTPASTVMGMLAESNKRFDGVLANLRTGALSNIGTRVIQNLIQISRSDPRWQALAIQTLGAKDGAMVNQVLAGPVEDIEELFGVNVTATSSQVNKEAHKQSFITLMQLASQVYPQLVQYANGVAQMQVNPQTGQPDPSLVAGALSASYSGLNELMTRLLETFDIQNPERYLPPVLPPPGAGTGAPVPPATAPLGGASGPAPFAQGGSQLAAMLGL